MPYLLRRVYVFEYVRRRGFGRSGGVDGCEAFGRDVWLCGAEVYGVGFCGFWGAEVELAMNRPLEMGQGDIHFFSWRSFGF